MPKSDRWMVAIVILAVAAIVSWAIYYQIAHPCLRTELRVCSENHCTLYMNPSSGSLSFGALDFSGGPSVCMSWETSYYNCNVCVERK